MSGRTSCKGTDYCRVLVVSVPWPSLQALITVCATHFGIWSDVCLYRFGLKQLIDLQKLATPPVPFFSNS